jgi:hypothetical protein
VESLSPNIQQCYPNIQQLFFRGVDWRTCADAFGGILARLTGLYQVHFEGCPVMPADYLNGFYKDYDNGRNAMFNSNTNVPRK